MSYGRLNIWLRYFHDCGLITDCWRQDLVIKTCDGKYLVDIDPSVIERIKARHPEYPVVKKSDNPEIYHHEKRIQLGYPDSTAGQFVYHVEVDIPPGCYVVWTRVCHGLNEETNKVMVIVHCGEEVCVNLLLNTAELCAREFFHPFLEFAVGKKMPVKNVEVAAKAIMEVAQKPEKEVAEELDLRMKEVKLMKDRKLVEVVGNVQKMFRGGRRMR